MSKSHYIFLPLLIMLSLSAYSQDKDHVFMKWKLQPNEVITYKAIMHDTASKISVKGIFGDTSTNSKSNKAQDLLNDIKSLSPDSYIVSLKKDKRNIININMILLPDSIKTDTVNRGNDFKNFRSLIKKMGSESVLRGAINEDGIIRSFYTASSQMNLLAVFFELPGRAVKVGDSWPINMHYISMDQNFICDSSYRKDEVKVVKITDKGDDKIVTLKYDIVEYVNGKFNSPFNNSPMNTMMSFSYSGNAEFSIKAGRWIILNGIMSNSSTGMISAESKEKIALVSSN